MKRINKERRREKDGDEGDKEITLDINEQGDYRLRTKNMKKIMN